MDSIKDTIDSKVDESKLASVKDLYKETKEHFDYLY